MVWICRGIGTAPRPLATSTHGVDESAPSGPAPLFPASSVRRSYHFAPRSGGATACRPATSIAHSVASARPGVSAATLRDCGGRPGAVAGRRRHTAGLPSRTRPSPPAWRDSDPRGRRRLALSMGGEPSRIQSGCLTSRMRRLQSKRIACSVDRSKGVATGAPATGLFARGGPHTGRDRAPILRSKGRRPFCLTPQISRGRHAALSTTIVPVDRRPDLQMSFDPPRPTHTLPPRPQSANRCAGERPGCAGPNRTRRRCRARHDG